MGTGATELLLSLLTQHPRLRIGIVLAERAAVTPYLRGQHADVFQLLDEVEQHIRPDSEMSLLFSYG